MTIYAATGLVCFSVILTRVILEGLIKDEVLLFGLTVGGITGSIMTAAAFAVMS